MTPSDPPPFRGFVLAANVTSTRSEDQRPVRDRSPHPDRLVDPDRRRILGAYEQADDRQALEQQPAEIAHAPLGVPAVADGGIDPHLLELNCERRPGGGLGLEEDRPVLLPEPGAPVLDLHARPPAEALRVTIERVDPDLLEVGRRA